MYGELTLKIGGGAEYEDGDVITAYNAHTISMCHCNIICNPWKNGVTSAGYRPSDTHVQRQLELTKEYKFVRAGYDKVMRFDLWRGGFEIFGPPEINVPEFIARRTKRKEALAPDGGPKLAIFGTPGAEVWYGGSTKTDQAIVSKVWDEIENFTPHHRDDDACRKYPMGNLDCRSHFRIRTADFSDEEMTYLAQPVFFREEVDGKRNKTLKRSSNVIWQDLPDLDPGIKRRIPDMILPVDVRDINLWFNEEIVLEKGIGKMVDLKALKNELETDPEGLGYSSMTDAEVATAINTSNRNFNKKIGSIKLISWAASSARYEKIEDAIANKGLPAGIRSVAKAADKILDRQDAELDMDEHGALIDVLVGAGILTAGDKAELIAMAATTGSRAEELGMDEVFESHVAHIRKSA